MLTILFRIQNGPGGFRSTTPYANSLRILPQKVAAVQALYRSFLRQRAVNGDTPSDRDWPLIVQLPNRCSSLTPLLGDPIGSYVLSVLGVSSTKAAIPSVTLRLSYCAEKESSRFFRQAFTKGRASSILTWKGLLLPRVGSSPCRNLFP